jgi:hypothetical protein
METEMVTGSTGDDELDRLVKFASRLRDNGVTTFELTRGEVTFKLVQDPLPLGPSEQAKKAERDLFEV